MKIRNILALLVVAFLVSCGGEEKKPATKTVKKAVVKKAPEQKTTTKSTTNNDLVDLANKGIGPVKSVTLGETVDQAMADNGQKIFKSKCSSCHRTNRKFIGPNPTGILEKRSPEWIMNMILNPVEMVQKDPIAKQLLIQYNGSPMANQNLTQDEARAVLEYFRTLK
ncbi:MAG: cytochrome c [Flavobacteriaceae bacterium]|nr:cytochrome c [Flavobacteriaceae bacterium]